MISGGLALAHVSSCTLTAIETIFKLCMSPVVRQSHYADLDKKWLDEVRYNHIDNELFNVPYAVVDRAAMAPRAPQLAVVKVTSSNTQCQNGLFAVDVFMLNVAYCYCMSVWRVLTTNCMHSIFLLLTGNTC